MTYADYDYYANAYMGNAIVEEDFPHLAVRASWYIDYITQNRAEKKPELEAVKMCCCALAEQYQAIDAAQRLALKSLNAGGGGMELQSETVGSWSRSYRSGGDSAMSAAQAAAENRAMLYQTEQQYLAHTGLLYRGGRCCR